MSKTIILDPSPTLWKRVKQYKLDHDPQYKNLNDVACMLIERGLSVSTMVGAPTPAPSPRAPLPSPRPVAAETRRAPAASHKQLGRPKGSKNSPPPNKPIWQRPTATEPESQDVPDTIKAIAEKVQREKEQAEREKPQEINTPLTTA